MPSLRDLLCILFCIFDVCKTLAVSSKMSEGTNQGTVHEQNVPVQAEGEFESETEESEKKMKDKKRKKKKSKKDKKSKKKDEKSKKKSKSKKSKKDTKRKDRKRLWEFKKFKSKDGLYDEAAEDTDAVDNLVNILGKTPKVDRRGKILEYLKGLRESLVGEDRHSLRVAAIDEKVADSKLSALALLKFFCKATGVEWDARWKQYVTQAGGKKRRTNQGAKPKSDAAAVSEVSDDKDRRDAVMAVVEQIKSETSTAVRRHVAYEAVKSLVDEDHLYIKKYVIKRKVGDFEKKHKDGANTSNISVFLWTKFYARALGVDWDEAWSAGIKAKGLKKTDAEKNVARVHAFARGLIDMLDVASGEKS